MADLRQVPAPPKIPPPPPPRSRATEAGENSASSLTEEHSGGARSKGPSAPDIELSVPAAPEKSEGVDMLSPPDFYPPKRYFVSRNPEGRGPQPKQPAEEPTPKKGFFRSIISSQSEPPRPSHTSELVSPSMLPSPDRCSPSRSPQKSPASASEEPTPKKGFFQSMYSRTKGLLSRKKESNYEPLRQQATAQNTPAATPALTPKKKRGLLSTFFGAKPIAPSNPDSSPSSSREYSRLNDSSLNESATEDPKAPGGGDDDSDAPECDRRADTESEVSESDLAMAAAAKPQDCDGGDVTEVCHIRVKGAADIRIGTSASGDVTTCVRTSTESKDYS